MPSTKKKKTKTQSPMLGAGGTLPAGDPASLLADLDAAHVAGAVVVQPACYGFDHSYVEAVVAASRGRLVGCALANPTLAPEDGAAEVRRLVRERGFRAIRWGASVGGQEGGWPGRPTHRRAVTMRLGCGGWVDGRPGARRPRALPAGLPAPRGTRLRPPTQPAHATPPSHPPPAKG